MLQDSDVARVAKKPGQERIMLLYTAHYRAETCYYFSNFRGLKPAVNQK